MSAIIEAAQATLFAAIEAEQDRLVVEIARIAEASNDREYAAHIAMSSVPLRRDERDGAPLAKRARIARNNLRGAMTLDAVAPSEMPAFLQAAEDLGLLLDLAASVGGALNG